VKTVSDEVLRHSLAYLTVRKRLVGDVPLNVNFALSEPSLAWQASNQRFQEIRRILYLHRNYYNGIWNY